MSVETHIGLVFKAESFRAFPALSLTMALDLEVSVTKVIQIDINVSVDQDG